MILPAVNFFGFKVSVFSKDELIQSIEETIRSQDSKIYYGYSLAVLAYLKKYPVYYNTTEGFDVMITDGRLFYLLAKFFGFRLKFDISIPQLTILSFEIANKMHMKLMMIGGTAESNRKAYENLKTQYPGILLCKGRDGYFKEEDKENIVELVRQNEPDILLLGFPTPAKQLFAAEIKKRIKGCVIIPCGGMIDIMSGKEKLTPGWIKKLGLASIYRHIQHPSRLPELFRIYLLALRVFVLCAYLKYINKKQNISIPYLINPKLYA